jgi:hypothetical protein
VAAISATGSYGTSSPRQASSGNVANHNTAHHDAYTTAVQSSSNEIHHAQSSSIDSHLTPTSISSLEDNDSSRFVGDLNPEGIFLCAASPGTTTGSIDDHVGVWVPRRALGQVRSRIANIVSDDSPRSALSGLDPPNSRLMFSLVEDECLRMIPSPVNFEALRHIYLEEVHPIFPIIDTEGFDKLHDNSISKIALKQAICLAACSNPRSKSHLRLPISVSNRTAILSAKAFAEQIGKALRTSIDTGSVKDRLICIQTISLLSLCTQFSDDRHSSAELSSRAVSYVQTVGIHLDTSATREDHTYVTTLFCCVWALDRLNAAFHGRPVLIHERDIGRELVKSIEQQEGAFQLLLRIVLLLDDVIKLYRPRASPTDDPVRNFPSFEDLLHLSGVHRIPAHILGKYKSSLLVVGLANMVPKRRLKHYTMLQPCCRIDRKT